MGFSYPKITLPITFKTRRKDNHRPAGVPKSTVHCLKTPFFSGKKKKIQRTRQVLVNLT